MESRHDLQTARTSQCEADPTGVHGAGTMIRPGLVSVTFRALERAEVVRVAANAGLRGIEWGGDVHAPHGDVAAARDAARLCADAGLEVAAYGSYYRLGDDQPERFAQVLDSALALGTPIIRVWAGRLGSRETDAAGRARVADDGRRIAGLAAAHGIHIASEWHGDTLTDTSTSASALLADIDHAAFGTYWQPHQRMAHAGCLADLDVALPRLLGLHVFHWDEADASRLPLSAGARRWRDYLARAAPRLDGWALLEFVRGDDPAQLVDDAATLRELLVENGRA